MRASTNRDDRGGPHISVEIKNGRLKTEARHCQKLQRVTQEAIDVFLLSETPDGDISGIGYWQVANGYTAIALHDRWETKKRCPAKASTTHNLPRLRSLLARVESRHPDYINEFNDDTLWWGHCLLQVYRISDEIKYVQQAVKIWRHVSKSVVRRDQHVVHGLDMEGGVFWTTNSAEDQLNSITTGLYSELSSLLCSINRDICSGLPSTSELQAAAAKSLSWIFRCRYRKDEAIVTDHIRLTSKVFVDWTFTYTTGQTIAACAALYDQTGDEDLIRLACDMTRKALCRPGWVESNGVLTEPGAYGPGTHEPWMNDDAVGFKSIIVRGLAKLYEVIMAHQIHGDVGDNIRNLVKINYQSLQDRDRTDSGQYGPWWNGPMALPTSHSQLAVLDVMAAIRVVDEPEDGKPW